MVFAEYYGLAVHSGASSVAYDSERTTLLVTAGWTPLIFTDATPDRQVVEATLAALNRAVGTATGTDNR